MVSLAVVAASFCILASLAVLCSTAASLVLWIRAGTSTIGAVPETKETFRRTEEQTKTEEYPGESPEALNDRLRRETEARERFEDGLRAILGYGNPISGGKAGQA